MTTRLDLLILAIVVVGVVVAVLLGAAIGGWLGGLLTRILVRSRLSALDLAIGAGAGAGSALLVLWLLATVIPALVGPGLLEPVTAILRPLGGHTAILQAVDTALPAPSRDLNALLHVTDGPPPA
jgi:uncharacterized membrane protein